MVAKISIIVVLSLCIVAIQLVPVIKNWGRKPCQSIIDRANSLEPHQIKEVEIQYHVTYRKFQPELSKIPARFVIRDPQEIAEILGAFRKTTLWPAAQDGDSPELMHQPGDCYYFTPKDSSIKGFNISVVFSFGDPPNELKGVGEGYGPEVAKMHEKYARRAFAKFKKQQ